MGISLADDRRLNVNDSIRTLGHLFDCDGDSVRDLLVEQAQCLLTDQLSRDLAHRLIGHGILIVVLRSIRKILEDQLRQKIRVLLAQCGYWNDLRKRADVLVRINVLCKLLLFLHGIHLVDDKNHRGLDLSELFCNVALTCSDERRRLHKPQNDIDFLERVLCNVDHVLAELVFRLVDARGVEEDDLSSLIRVNGLDAVSRRLRFV